MSSRTVTMIWRRRKLSQEQEERKESFYRGLSIGLITAALVAVLLTALNVRTILQARRIQEAYSPPPGTCLSQRPTWTAGG